MLITTLLALTIALPTPDPTPDWGTNDTEKQHVQTYRAPSTTAAGPLMRALEFEAVLITRYSWPVPSTPQTDQFRTRACVAKEDDSDEPCFENHKGIDLTPGLGTPIKAVTAATVTYAGDEDDGYGYKVVLDHGDGTETLYAHLKDVPSVSRGDAVARGDVIGYVGSTGRSTGAHLHFEVHVDGTPVEPNRWMRERDALPYP